MRIGDLVKIIPVGGYEQYRCGSLGDGRYVSLCSGVTGRIKAIQFDGASIDPDSVLFVPSGFPENKFTRGWFMGISLFEAWDGDEVNCEVFYQKDGKRIPAPYTLSPG